MTSEMPGAARALAEWAVALEPSADDVALAQRSLTDTIAVGLAAREDPVLRTAASLSECGRWAVACHILDFDDLHMPSTTHISAVCVPVALASGGDERAYLAGAGVMARLGAWLGPPHYASGWHATTTAGALAAAVTAAHARGFDAEQVARAMALAVPSAGGVQRSFGTAAKSLQVGFAAEAGIRAAGLVEAGATADPSAVDVWLSLMRGTQRPVAHEPAVPDGLAVKLYPCCYALQRPIAAVAELAKGIDAGQVRGVVVRTPAVTVSPLIHHRPRTGLEGKFSLEYGVAVALLDDYQGFASFSDDAVLRHEAQRLVDVVEVELTDGGDWLLAGQVDVVVDTDTGVLEGSLAFPPGSPQRPPTTEQLDKKTSDCLAGLDVDRSAISWPDAAETLRSHLPPGNANAASSPTT